MKGCVAVFELFNEVYAEKRESGKYSAFSGDGSIKVYININQCMSFPKAARLVRNIARQIADYQGSSCTELNEGGAI